MPSDHAEVVLSDVRVPQSAILGEEGHGLQTALFFVHENRIRQAASGVGVADFCVRESVEYAKQRITFGKPLAERQAIQWPLVELATDVALLRTFIRATAAEMDSGDRVRGVSDRVSMCNYRANRLACDAADRAMQVHGGLGYTRAKPFEHIYRHHRRYRITEGSEEIQIRNVAGHLFGFISRAELAGMAHQPRLDSGAVSWRGQPVSDRRRRARFGHLGDLPQAFLVPAADALVLA